MEISILPQALSVELVLNIQYSFKRLCFHKLEREILSSKSIPPTHKNFLKHLLLKEKKEQVNSELISF